MDGNVLKQEQYIGYSELEKMFKDAQISQNTAEETMKHNEQIENSVCVLNETDEERKVFITTLIATILTMIVIVVVTYFIGKYMQSWKSIRKVLKLL